MLHNMAALLESKSVEKRRSYYRAYASSAALEDPFKLLHLKRRHTAQHERVVRIKIS